MTSARSETRVGSSAPCEISMAHDSAPHRRMASHQCLRPNSSTKKMPRGTNMAMLAVNSTRPNVIQSVASYRAKKCRKRQSTPLVSES